MFRGQTTHHILTMLEFECRNTDSLCFASVGSINSTADACSGQNRDPSGETVAGAAKFIKFLELKS